MEETKGAQLITFSGEQPVDYLINTPSEKFSRHSAIFKRLEQQTAASGNQPLYLVTSGLVAMEAISDNGRITYMHLRGKDDVIGFEALMGIPYSTTARCLTDVEVQSWPARDIVCESKRNLRLAGALIAAQTVHELEDELHMAMAANMRTAQSLAAWLLLIADKAGQTLANGTRQIPPITQEELSRFVWTTREIITHHINILRRMHWLTFSRKGIWIRGGDQLLAFSLASAKAAREVLRNEGGLPRLNPGAQMFSNAVFQNNVGMALLLAERLGLRVAPKSPRVLAAPPVEVIPSPGAGPVPDNTRIELDSLREQVASAEDRLRQAESRTQQTRQELAAAYALVSKLRAKNVALALQKR